MEQLKSVFIVAVSGGVDSVVLLDMLVCGNMPGVKFVVAHVDHGIRDASADDAMFVSKIAAKYGLPFELHEAALGEHASEAQGRAVRYAFFNALMTKYSATAVITAHHKDDVLETMCINMLRGTGRRGLTSLAGTTERRRPLIHMHKAELVAYAIEHDLAWVEDETNYGFDYLRNRVRARLEAVGGEVKNKLYEIYEEMLNCNQEIDTIFESMYVDKLERKDFVMLDHATSKEVISYWLRRQNIGFDEKMIEYLAVRAKTAPAGAVFEAKGGRKITFGKENVVAN
jgi:tRNA(Ile)-lysidine synthase